MNDITDFGTYQIHGTTLHSPFGANAGGIFIVVKVNDTTQIAQIAFRSDAASAAYRVKWDDGWRDWRVIPYDVSSLASALGVRYQHIDSIDSGSSIDITEPYCLVKIKNSSSGDGAFFRFDNSVVDISSDSQYSVGQEENSKISIVMKSESTFTIKNGTSTSKRLDLAIYYVPI